MQNDGPAQIAAIIERLCANHPEMSSISVAATVEHLHERFSGSAVREFAPLLVERCAERELSGIPPRLLRRR
ncbi:three-helix bundle dimerization domain-containing protein [Nocardia mexicana]|uniref:three-helix bundle dimerization domain-containing protein n=1 Tax=Nocardia mexicana TaxID=279262 RepID=UPI0035A24485